jgi:ribosomal protein S27E
MNIDLPDTEGGNVISIEVLRKSRYQRRLMDICPHHATLIDTALAKVICKDCGAELNPIEWVAMMSEEWHRVTLLYQRLKEQKQQTDAKIQELEAKIKVKCQHCGRFTLRRYN